MLTPTAPDLPMRCRTNIAVAWLFTAATIAALWIEYRHYVKMRFKWLTLPRTHNYSVMVRSSHSACQPALRCAPPAHEAA